MKLEKFHEMSMLHYEHDIQVIDIWGAWWSYWSSRRPKRLNKDKVPNQAKIKEETYVSVKVLDLRNNDWSLWEDIDRLSKVFPSKKFASKTALYCTVIYRRGNGKYNTDLQSLQGQYSQDQLFTGSRSRECRIVFHFKGATTSTLISNEEQWNRLISKHNIPLEHVKSSLNDCDKVCSI